ncbi:MAG: FkbM family methyltransferase [Nibricoccus sp.]
MALISGIPGPRPIVLPKTLRLLRRLPFPHKLGIAERFFGRGLAQHGVCWAKTAAGPVWKLDLANCTHRWMLYGDYEGPALWNWLRRRTERVDTIVDSGANIGQTVLSFSALLPRARIIAYEPGTEARAWLSASVEANAFEHVSIQPFGLGSRPSDAFLAQQGDAKHLRGSWNRVSSSEGEPIRITTLDAEMIRLGLNSIDIWKLDVEGFELEALRGAEKALLNHAVRAIYLETTGDGKDPSLTYLREHNYTIHAITDSGRLSEWKPRGSLGYVLCLPNSSSSQS